MKIKYSALVMGASGKLNGSVAASNKGGAYIRNKGVVSNPQTVSQQEVRGRFGAISSQFRALTPSQVAAWNTAAADFPIVDRLGDTRYLSGLGLFVQLNTNLQSIGQPIIVNPPAKQAFPSLTPIVAEFTSTAGVLATLIASFSSSEVLVEEQFYFLVKSAPIVDYSVHNLTNRMRVISVLPSLDGAFQELDMGSSYIAKFGAAGAIGQHSKVDILIVSPVSGEASVVYSGDAPVVSS